MYDDKAPRLIPGRSRGLVWLVGMDGNDPATDPREDLILQRMLARRRQPVTVPEEDRMPTDVPDPYSDGTQSR